MKRADEWQPLLDGREAMRRAGPDDARAVIALVQDTARWVQDVNGRRFARLDCWAETPALCAYYPRLGYTRLQPDEPRLRDMAWFQKRMAP